LARLNKSAKLKISRFSADGAICPIFGTLAFQVRRFACNKSPVSDNIELGVVSMRGRKPKPVQSQIAAGDPRKKGVHRLEQQLAAEPKATRGLPPCPRHLKGRARAAWIFWSKELVAMDIDRRPDAHMLEGAAINYEAAIASYETVQTQGRLIAKKKLDPKTNSMVIVDVKPHPAVRQGNQAWALMKSFCSEFGLSPVSRLRLAIEMEDSDEDDLMELLSRPREKRLPPAVQ
jgi:P27 family predicted phage terminase small subunit